MQKSINKVYKTRCIVELCAKVIVPSIVIDEYGRNIWNRKALTLEQAILFGSIKSYDWNYDLALLLGGEHKAAILKLLPYTM